MNKVKNSHGFGLVEVLVASIIIAIGLLGAASLQSTALNNMKNNSKELMVELLINEMAQYIIANPREAERGYSSMYNLSLSSPNLAFYQSDNCFNSTGCSTWNIAANDIVVWQQRILEHLGANSSGSIGFDSATNSTGTPPYGNTSMSFNSGVHSIPIFTQSTPVSQYPTRIIYTIKIQYKDTQGNSKIKTGQANTPFNPWNTLKHKPAATVLFDSVSSLPLDCSWKIKLEKSLLGAAWPNPTWPPDTQITPCPTGLSPTGNELTTNAYDPGHLTKQERDQICIYMCVAYGSGNGLRISGACACNTTNPNNSTAMQ